ncbi:MAG: PAS domain S-box protein, partial [Syntrophales bacterium]
MAEQEILPNLATDLRHKAEEIARERADQPSGHGGDTLLQDVPAMTAMIHELRVHQIELEMQNSALRRAQLELEASRARYFDLYDLAPVGYVTVSEKGIISEANLTAATLLGVARGALVKQRLTQFIHKEDQDIYFLQSKQLFETGEPQARELRIVKKDSPAFWLHLEMEPAVDRDTDGGLVSRVVMSDITERKLKESHDQLEEIVEERSAQLRQEIEARERPQEFLEEGSDTILLVDDEPLVLSALTRTLRNTPFQVLTAPNGIQALAIMESTKINVIVSDEQMEGMRGWELLAEVRRRFPNTVRILLSGHATLELAMRAVNDGGIYRFLAKPCDDGMLRFTLSAATEKYNMEAKSRILQDALRQSEERFRTVVEWSPNSGIIHRDLKIIYANPAAIKMLGAASLQDLAGSSLLDRIHPDDHQVVQERSQKVMQDGVGVPMIELTYLKLDGTMITVEAQGTPIIYDGVSAIHTAMHDITKRKHAEDALQETLEQLESRVRERTIELEETNTALRVLLKKGDKDQQRIEDSLQSNVNQLVTPFLAKLANSRSDHERQTYLNIVETNLDNIVSPFINRLSTAHK